MGEHTTGDSHVARNRLWARLSAAVAGMETPPATPLMVVDLDAFDANATDLVRRAGGKPIR
jgi:D-serine deaminase-like pyridoxal phosphate-dependent protein